MARKKAVGTDYIPQDYTTNTRKQKVKTSYKRKNHWIATVTPGVTVIALIFIIGISLVVQHAWINFLGFQISELKKEITETKENNEKLKFQIAALGSLDRIEDIAINQLGMVHPEKVQYIFSDDLEKHDSVSNVQITGFNPPDNISQESDKIIPKKTLLGTAQDFFLYLINR